MRRIIAGGDLTEYARLDLLIRGRAEGLGHIEGDLTRSQGVEHDRGERRQAQAPFDEAHGQAKTARDFLSASALGSP